MKIKLLIALLTLSVSQIAISAGKAESSNAKNGDIYIIGAGVVKKNPNCDLIDPISSYERLSKIDNTTYICYSADNEYFQYIARNANDNDSVEFEMGLENNFDGTWYGYVFEYKLNAENALPDEVYQYDLTAEQVQSCRAAFEPPFVCEGP